MLIANCANQISVVHGGFNDVTRHTKGPTHQQRFGQPSELSHIRNVTTAEVIMSNFIAMHNISFQTADVCVSEGGITEIGVKILK